MTRVALINPGKNQEFADNEPLSLGSLAAYLMARGMEVRIVDELAGADVKAELLTFKPDLVGVTATTPLANDAYAWLAVARGMKIPTVMGGVHASVLPDEAARYADHVVTGEGEEALLALARGETKEKIICGTAIKNIDDIPPAARGLINMDFYVNRKNRIPTAHLYFLKPGMRLASLITSRGCPYSCIFCHNSWKGLPVRYNSARRVVDDIATLNREYGADALFFMDDDFFVNKARLKEICALMLERDLKLSWAANARVTSVTPEILSVAREAGCREISFGIESGSQKILDIMNKRTTVEQGEKAIRMAKEAGILVYATFMIGNPEETREDIEQTRRFILRNRIDSIGIGITTPYPGTKLWDMCAQDGLKTEGIDWRTFTMESCPVNVNRNFSRAEIEKMRAGIIFQSMLRRGFKFIWFYVKGLLFHPAELWGKISGVLQPLAGRSRR